MDQHIESPRIIRDRLIDLKDCCWEKGRLNREGVENFAIEVRNYEREGYNVRLYEQVASLLFEALQRQKGDRIGNST